MNMSRGKRICAELKQIRRNIAEENGIPLEIPECSYQGECRGTCPRCEAEVRYLEQQLTQRLKMGRAATVAGVAVSLATLTACNNGSSPSITPPDTTPTALDTVTVGPQPELPNAAIQAEGIVSSPSGEQHIQAAKNQINTNLPVVGGIEIIDNSSCTPDLATKSDALVEGEEVGGIEEIEEFPELDEYPEFPGGMEALHKYMADNIQYPQEAQDNHISGRVYVTFVVKEDGSVSNVKVVRDIGGGCGREAARVVRSMPKWHPAKKNGEPVRAVFTLPINFTLE